jgi:hypothetical protein
MREVGGQDSVRQQFRSILEVHCVVMAPFAAPDKAVRARAALLVVGRRNDRRHKALDAIAPVEMRSAGSQRQSHLRIDVCCIGAQRRERHADETNSFPHRKLGRE